MISKGHGTLKTWLGHVRSGLLVVLRIPLAANSKRSYVAADNTEQKLGNLTTHACRKAEGKKKSGEVEAVESSV